jgi:DNA modification methylase
MGSLYRSLHELLPLFKNGSAPVNSVELGKRGRWRSNVRTYPGASLLGSDARRGLENHPTVKPTAILEDAPLDFTDRGDIIIDRSAARAQLVAAKRNGRGCRGVEFDPTPKSGPFLARSPSSGGDEAGRASRTKFQPHGVR